MTRKLSLIFLSLFFALYLAGCSAAGIEQPTTAPVSRPPTAAFDCDPTLTGGKNSQIPTISLSQLVQCRPEVQTTINLIRSNGPFKYDQDNAVFQNREGFLPSKTTGTYHEYTVITPGASNRSTRRIITAGNPSRKPAAFTSMYYTDDHYETFWLVSGN